MPSQIETPPSLTSASAARRVTLWIVAGTRKKRGKLGSYPAVSTMIQNWYKRLHDQDKIYAKAQVMDYLNILGQIVDLAKDEIKKL